MVGKVKLHLKKALSLKILLTLILVVTGIAPMILQSMILDGSFNQNQIDDRMIEVQNQCLILSNKMTRANYMSSDTAELVLTNEMSVVADVFNGRIALVDKNFRIIKDTFELATGKVNVSEEVIKCFQGENYSKYNREKNYFAMTIPVYQNLEEKTVDGVMVVTTSTENIAALSEKVHNKGIFLIVTSAWVILLAALALSRVLLRPFDLLQKILNHVEDGNLDESVRVETYKETSQMSMAIERTLNKLKAIDQSRAEFVSNVSHELKTPITSIRVLADSLMGMDDVPVELYREFMSDISDEIDRESKIIDDLLTLVRMDKSATEMNIEQININNLMELILKRLRPIAKKRNIELIFESIREVIADVDEVKLSLALTNLVENAIKYNVEGGWVRVVLDADHKFFYVKVIDSGIGIPEEFQSHVFERFYRVDKARSRETGGTGLGLAITHNVIMMHKGAIKLQSKDGEGTTFTVRIPRTYIA